MDRIRLSTADSVLELVPRVGGGIARLNLGGREILRAASVDALARGDPRELAEFPMGPWVNRVAGGRFVWQGATVATEGAPVSEPLGLHGFAWKLPWRVDSADAQQCRLTLDWPGGDVWPWACRMERAFQLSGRELRMQMSLTNLSARTMPGAIGSHPYFLSADAVVHARVGAGWTTDAALLPVAPGMAEEARRLGEGAAVDTLTLDTCFDGWDGRVRIAYPDHAVEISADNARYLQIYTPKGAGYFCVEPQTAMPDAPNRGVEAGLAVLGPGQSLETGVRIASSE